MFERNEPDVGNQSWICHNERIGDMYEYVSPNFGVLNCKGFNGLDWKRQEIQTEFLYSGIFCKLCALKSEKLILEAHKVKS
jgi:hypothetical protein